MPCAFAIAAWPADQFQPLFGLSREELDRRGIFRVTADEKPGYPCRITLEDAEPGETLLLLAFEHQPAASPYRASGPIFVRERAGAAYDSDAFRRYFMAAACRRGPMTQRG